MTATRESTTAAPRLATLWYVRYAITGVAFGGAWLSEHGASLGMHALRGGLVLAAALAIVLWRWSRWTGAGAVGPWSALALTEVGVLVIACVLSPLLAHPHGGGRPDMIVAAVGALAVATLSPLVHHLVGGPCGYHAPAAAR